jgi:hypothetical protein
VGCVCEREKERERKKERQREREKERERERVRPAARVIPNYWRWLITHVSLGAEARHVAKQDVNRLCVNRTRCSMEERVSNRS